MFVKLLHRVGIDDPVDAVPIHLGGGIWGVLAVALFSHEKGLFITGSLECLKTQLLGLLVIMGWGAGSMIPLFYLLNKLGKLRVPRELEKFGIDKATHTERGYLIKDIAHAAQQLKEDIGRCGDGRRQSLTSEDRDKLMSELSTVKKPVECVVTTVEPIVVGGNEEEALSTSANQVELSCDLPRRHSLSFSDPKNLLQDSNINLDN
eukprot:GHVR01153595.1.p1 GENE.GHVR01153595.1~~GHVR01153595.1.p1  ORF type:complete len:206 (+),score=57.56 GHVR01153595.1:162-779(+)